MQTLKYFEALNTLARNVESLEIDTFYECKGAYQFLEKALKTLDIIKEKKVNIGIFYFVVFILKANYDGCKTNNKTVLYNICDIKKEFLTKEEFDILKGVLE